MAYSSIVEMAQSNSLLNRVAAAAAGEGESDPLTWVHQNAWEIAAQPGWADAWDYARDNATADDNPDTGARPAVISDGMILASVQAIRATP